MVSIVAPESSAVDIINVALTTRDFEKDGFRCEQSLLSEERTMEFWRDPTKFTDKDRMVIVINLNVNREMLESSSIETGDLNLIYVPSKWISLPPTDVELLFNKGFSIVSQREPHKCFSGEGDEFWEGIGEILSMELVSGDIQDIYQQTSVGLIRATENNPHEAISKVINNDVTYFNDLDKSLPNCEIKEELEKTVSAFCEGVAPEELAPLSFKLFLNTWKPWVEVTSEENFAILTLAPTWSSFVFKENKIEFNKILRLGKGAVFTLPIISEFLRGVILGKTFSDVIINFKNPRSITTRTLRRKIIGDKTTERRGDKVYYKKYRSLKDIYSNIKISRKNIITPFEATEEVIDILKEADAKYTMSTP